VFCAYVTKDVMYKILASSDESHRSFYVSHARIILVILFFSAHFRQLLRNAEEYSANFLRSNGGPRDGRACQISTN